MRFAKRNVGSCVSINDEAGLPDATRMERNPAALAPAISVAVVMNGAINARVKALAIDIMEIE